MRETGRRWTIAVAAVLVVAAAGCSSNSGPTAENLEPPAATTPVVASDPADMYLWDPEGGFHNAVLSGTLVVEHPCVYVDVASTTSETQVVQGGPVRSIVRLPEPLTRYDFATGELWVGDYGPMSDGDEVVVVGSEGWQEEWQGWDPTPRVDGMRFFANRSFEEVFNDVRAECLAHLSFWAASMRPDGADAAGVPLAADLPGLGLFAWDIDLPHVDVGYSDGFLVIDPPCVYIQWTAPTPQDTAESRYHVYLPRPNVRYDAESNALWYETQEPFHDGDKVSVGAGDLQSYAPTGSIVSKNGCTAMGKFEFAALRHPDG